MTRGEKCGGMIVKGGSIISVVFWLCSCVTVVFMLLDGFNILWRSWWTAIRPVKETLACFSGVSYRSTKGILPHSCYFLSH